MRKVINLIFLKIASLAINQFWLKRDFIKLLIAYLMMEGKYEQPKIN